MDADRRRTARNAGWARDSERGPLTRVMAAPLGTALATIAEWRGPHVLYCENFEGRFSATAGPPAVIFEDDLTYSYLAPGAMGGMLESKP